MPFKNLRETQQNNRTGRKHFAVLLDPDNLYEASCLQLLQISEASHVDFFFVGGSLITTENQATIIQLIKQHSHIPVILFPSNSLHIDKQADGILLLSLISGRNPDF